MTRAYQVVWAGVAENDLKEILEYIAIDEPLSALEIFQEIKQRTSSLYTFMYLLLHTNYWIRKIILC